MNEDIQKRIDDLAAALSDPNGLRRQSARQALANIGRPAVPALVQALQDRSWRVRWEAGKALERIADPSTVDPLIAALLDDVAEVRWVCAEALAAIGWPAIAPLLRALVTKADRAYFREGAHYVLRTLEARGIDADIDQVISALDSVEPSIDVPIAAEEALARGAGMYRSRRP